MTRLLELPIALAHERIAAMCEPCVGCGEPGTWGDGGMCPGCHKEALYRSAAQVREEGLERLRKDRPGTLTACGIPPRYARSEFEEPTSWPSDPRHPDLSVKGWKGVPWSVLLTGPTGCGKTMTACEMAYRRRCDGRAARFVRASRLPRLYFSRDRRYVAELETVELLLVDDVGRGHPGQAWEAIGELIAARYDGELATVVTSNLSLSDIAGFDAHAADRLSEGLVIALVGESRRELRLCSEPRI